MVARYCIGRCFGHRDGPISMSRAWECTTNRHGWGGLLSLYIKQESKKWTEEDETISLTWRVRKVLRAEGEKYVYWDGGSGLLKPLSVYCIQREELPISASLSSNVPHWPGCCKLFSALTTWKTSRGLTRITGSVSINPHFSDPPLLWIGKGRRLLTASRILGMWAETWIKECWIEICILPSICLIERSVLEMGTKQKTF